MENKYLARSAVVLTLLVGLTISCMAGDAPAAGGCVTIKQRCKTRIKQTKWGFELGGIDFTSGPLKKVGQVKLGTELIQKLTDTAQIMDQMQLSRCQLLNSLTTCDEVRQRILIVMAISNEQLGQLAVLAQMYSGNAEKLQEALLKWIISSTDLTQKIYAKLFLSSDANRDQDIAKASAAMSFALGQMRLSPDSAEFKVALADPLRSKLIE